MTSAFAVTCGSHLRPFRRLSARTTPLVATCPDGQGIQCHEDSDEMTTTTLASLASARVFQNTAQLDLPAACSPPMIQIDMALTLASPADAKVCRSHTESTTQLAALPQDEDTFQITLAPPVEARVTTQLAALPQDEDTFQITLAPPVEARVTTQLAALPQKEDTFQITLAPSVEARVTTQLAALPQDDDTTQNGKKKNKKNRRH